MKRTWFAVALLVWGCAGFTRMDDPVEKYLPAR